MSGVLSSSINQSTINEQCNLSPCTVTAYLREIKRFDKFFNIIYGYKPDNAEESKIRDYFSCCYPEYIQSLTSLSLHFSAVKYWFTQIQGKSFDEPFNLPDIEICSPRILSRDELERLLFHTRNHTCGIMIKLIYASGFKLNEVIKIRVGDVDFTQHQIQLRNGNDSPERKGQFPGSIKYILMREAQKKIKTDYLFSLRLSPKGEYKPVSKRTVQNYLANSSVEINLGRITIQTLRDNFAIHLIQKGVDLKRVIEHMGYKNNRSVLRYKKYVPDAEIKIVSPLDDLS